MGNNLQFKFGAYADLSTSKGIKNGDVCFGQYSSKTDEGALKIKYNDKLMGVLPPSGPMGQPLIGQGEGKAPGYKSYVYLSYLKMLPWDDLVGPNPDSVSGVLQASIDLNNKKTILTIGRRDWETGGPVGDNTYTGQIVLMQKGLHINILPRTDITTTATGSYTYLYLPLHPTSNIYGCALWSNISDGDAQEGNASTPVYIDTYGRARPCDGIVVTTGSQSFSGSKTFGWIYSTHCMPAENTSVLGQSTNPWANIFTYSLNFYGYNNNAPILAGSLDGFTSSSTSSTTNKGAACRLTLGNAIVSENSDGTFNSSSRWGEIYLYGKNNQRCKIIANDNLSNTTVYLPNGGGACHAQCVWTPSYSYGTTQTGDENTPIYVASSGRTFEVKSVAISKGGTGATSFTANRLLFKDNTEDKLIVSTHYVDNTHLSINQGSIGRANFFVFGTSQFGEKFHDHQIVLGGKVVLPHSEYQYGTRAPASNTNLSNPSQGQIYFHII